MAMRPGDFNEVYDPFAGGGSTMPAADELGMVSYCMEVNPAQAIKVVERWREYQGAKS